jgi:hypothetical protein
MRYRPRKNKTPSSEPFVRMNIDTRDVNKEKNDNMKQLGESIRDENKNIKKQGNENANRKNPRTQMKKCVGKNTNAPRCCHVVSRVIIFLASNL